MHAFVERELKLDLEEGFTLPDLPGDPVPALHVDLPRHA